MIQSGWVGRQNRRKLWSRGVVFTKLKYRFIVFSVFFLRYSVFSVAYLEYRLRYRYRYFEIPRYSVSISVTDPGLYARTHSRCLKLIKIHQASPSFRSFPYSSTFNHQSKSQSKISPDSPISNPTKTYPNSLQTSSTHLFVLYNSLLCSIIECFPTFHIVFDLSFSYATSNRLETFTMWKPSSAEFNEGHSIGFPSTLPKSKIPTSGFFPPCWILSTRNLHHLKALLILVNLGTYMLVFLQLPTSDYFHFRFLGKSSVAVSTSFGNFEVYARSLTTDARRIYYGCSLRWNVHPGWLL